MNKNKILLKRFLQILLPLIIIVAIISISSQVQITNIKSGGDLTYVKAEVTRILEDNTGGSPYVGSQKLLAKITRGEFKGKICELENPNTYNRGAFCVEGTKIIARISESSEGKLVGSVYNYDRTSMVYFLLIMLALTLICVGGKKGLASLYALAFTFLCVIFMYIPLLYIGMNGILSAILTAIVILIASIYIINGWSMKTLCAIIGTTCGIAISGLLSMLVGTSSNLTGYNIDDIESMLFITSNSGVQISHIIYAGILISSLGAVMDVAVSVVASMQEVHEKVPTLSAKELFASGMRVGRDMIGTMSNTLILAYTGSATTTILTIYAYEMPYLQIMGYNSIIVEILCGLCGTIGVILTVPIQALITALILKLKKK